MSDEKISKTKPARSKRGRSPLQPERAPTEYALLGVLLDGPGYGYDLTHLFTAQSSLGQVCRVEMSMLYALLRKLESEGLIEGREEASSGQRSRRLVELTGAGRAEVEEWLARPVRHTREIRLGFMVKLYFTSRRNPALARRLIEEQLAYNQKLLNQLESQPFSASAAFEDWLHDFRVEQNRAVVNWLTRCRQQLVATPLPLSD